MFKDKISTSMVEETGSAKKARSSSTQMENEEVTPNYLEAEATLTKENFVECRKKEQHWTLKS